MFRFCTIILIVDINQICAKSVMDMRLINAINFQHQVHRSVNKPLTVLHKANWHTGSLPCVEMINQSVC